MNSPAYLAMPHVSGFISWLASELDSESTFQHSYINRRSLEQWSCVSLFNAFELYRWNHPGNTRLNFKGGSCFHSNGLALAALCQDLADANHEDSLILRAAVDVMRWGGVTARNESWLCANELGLGRMVQEVQAAIDAGNTESLVLRSKALRFNSGMTKVYSLLCKDFIIYDSRVAAGLGWLVVKYCQAHNLFKVPEALCFPWAAAKESDTALVPKHRNPGIGGLKFKGLRSGHHHATWNMRASWVLGSVLTHPSAAGSRFHSVSTPNEPLRALEAALFMIGYDLGHQS